MPRLIEFMLTNLSIGALIGAAFWTALSSFNSDFDVSGDFISAILGLWGFGSLFAAGYLTTALSFMPYEVDDY